MRARLFRDFVFGKFKSHYKKYNQTMLMAMDAEVYGILLTFSAFSLPDNKVFPTE
ncbi:hypothetical protein ACTHQ8_04605 [Lysinibacillus odysseyi]|uniref:hypothetical protein n=1 Tax=Lysinibacillus odysseyi TaxID=202611 RepID=UPI000AB37DF6|nr:hypothetical protein [Lysinibacillus odysseyi]